jgi:PKD repeat protein
MEPISYTWNFGDGRMATGAHISHTYAAAGAYMVMMTATNCTTGTAVASHTIIVRCDPIEAVTIAGPGSLRVGETGFYSATYTPITATAPVTYTWNNGRSFGTASNFNFADISSTSGPTATYSWTMPGIYTITVTATNDCGSASGNSIVEVRLAIYAVYLPLISR